MDFQLAEMVGPDEIEDYPERVGERKVDGVRIASSEGRLYTRSGRDVTAQFPEIDPPEMHTFDGELVTSDFTFESANRRVQTEDSFKVEVYADRWPAMLCVFDALAINGSDVTGKPFTERRELLEPSIPEGCGLTPTTVHDDAEALWAEAVENDWEGIMLKNPDAPYTGGRGDDWLKVKRWSEDTFPIVGAERTENDGFVIRVGIGADEPQKVVVNGEADQAAVANGADAAEVQYLERSKNGRLRKPSFKGVA